MPVFQIGIYFVHLNKNSLVNKPSLNILILIILIAVLVFSINLVYLDYTIGDICPKIGMIPACYLVLFYFIILLLLHIFKTSVLIFIIFSGFALALAIFSSVGQLIGVTQCPKSDFGFPLCYIALLFFSSLILMKFIEEKRKS